MQKTEITCDGCGEDLTRTGNCVDYRLALENEGIPSYGVVVTSMAAYPAIERSHHFCDLECLDHWTDRRRHRNALWRAWHEQWKRERGTKHENGMGGVYWSYPSEPETDRKRRYAEFEAAALAAFPMARPKRAA